MAYTKELLEFRELTSDELMEIGGGLTSGPGVGGGGNTGASINYSLSPNRSTLSIGGTLNFGDGNSASGTFDFATQSGALNAIDLSLTQGSITETGTINLVGDYLGETLTETWDNGSTGSVTVTEGADGNIFVGVTFTVPIEI